VPELKALLAPLPFRWDYLLAGERARRQCQKRRPEPHRAGRRHRV